MGDASSWICTLRSATVLFALAIMAGGLFGVFHNRLKAGAAGIGARITQLVTVVLAVPSILILGILDVLQGETIAALFGSLIGYVLSGVGEHQRAENRKND